MGTILHAMTLVGPNGEQETVDALVDTGATFTTVPAQLLERLGVRPVRQVRLRLADGREHSQDLGFVSVQLDGMAGPTPVVFGEPESPATIGAVTLESFLLGVDPVDQRLVPVVGWRA